VFNKSKQQLAPPPLADQRDAAEALRVWVLPDWSRMQVALQTRHDDPSLWGILLADVARHAAKAYALNGKCSENDALRRIREVFDAEWSSPTDLPEGFLRD
jgi:hypothetical protein